MDDIEEWTRQVMEEVTKHTKTIQLTSDNPEVDPHLLHIWEARQGLLKRWKKQKRNRKLKVRIALLTREAEEYAEKLGIQNWNQLCDRLQGTLSNRKTWAILRSLLAKTESKKVTCQHIQRLIHNYQGSEEDVLEAITEKYIGNQQQQTTTITHLDYEGKSNPELDQPFSRAEIQPVVFVGRRDRHPVRDCRLIIYGTRAAVGKLADQGPAVPVRPVTSPKGPRDLAQFAHAGLVGHALHRQPRDIPSGPGRPERARRRTRLLGRRLRTLQEHWDPETDVYRQKSKGALQVRHAVNAGAQHVCPYPQACTSPGAPDPHHTVTATARYDPTTGECVTIPSVTGPHDCQKFASLAACQAACVVSE
ncbi:uncharacterized protein ISCGN_009258 [Ixodes scapularis]